MNHNRASECREAHAFWRDGYVVFRNVFSVEEIQQLRRDVYQTLQRDESEGLVVRDADDVRAARGDLLSKPLLKRVLLDGRIVALYRKLITPAPVYFGDSNYQVGSSSVRRRWLSWHKDNRLTDRSDPNGLDWSGDYTLVRFGVYLQDHAHHSGGLAIRSGSHLAASSSIGTPVMVDSRPGDVVAWSLRTTHAGHALRLRVFRNLVLRRGMRFVPDLFIRAEEQERCALFITLGTKDEHLNRYVEYFRQRDYGDDYLRNSRFDSAVWDEIRRSGLEVLKPIPEYGAPTDPRDH